MYIWQQNNFPNFLWDSQRVLQKLSEVKFTAGKLSGMMGALGFDVTETAALDAITSDIIMSSAIADNRKAYYAVLEHTQKGSLDISEWLLWFLECLGKAMGKSITVTNCTLRKAMFWSEHRDMVFNSRQIKIINMLWDGFDGKLQTGKWAKINQCSTDTALRDIQDLVGKGVLEKKESNGRNTEYVLRFD